MALTASGCVAAHCNTARDFRAAHVAMATLTSKQFAAVLAVLGAQAKGDTGSHSLWHVLGSTQLLQSLAGLITQLPVWLCTCCNGTLAQPLSHSCLV